MRQEGKSVIFKDIEMGPTAFERESFVPVCISITFVRTSKSSEIQRVSVFAQPILFRTNDSLSNAIGPISISLKMIDLLPLDAFMKFWNRCISEPFEIQTK